MSIVVTTPTGRVGSRVVRVLLQAGVRPRVLVRDPARLDPATRGLVDVRTGDMTDTAFVREATAGARTVFWVDPTQPTGPDPNAASERTAAGLVDAARAGDVARVVLLSSIGAELRGGAGHIDALGRIEECLDATGADTLHLRCAYFFSNLLFSLDDLARGVLPTQFHPERPMAWVDPRDIGDVAAARLLAGEWKGRVVQAVHGPEDLSFLQVAEILTGVLGRPVRAEAVSDADVRAALGSAGLPPGAVEAVAGMAAGTRDFTPEQPRDVLTTTPTTLAAWAYAHLRPRVSEAMRAAAARGGDGAAGAAA
ncbi:NmrA family transcriptional regulator [Streptomyces sp. CNQ-509]|uniref:NmrA family NAD(P)-binding protein n=1 Tax=Streptomyces sp. CNQ-509 TaxID=444103 RepID=UPI00062E013B|nr:NAD(P)H-binding protein [Streptomyces sp. CNQ-509]AKH85847.1 NmrA family transcriptional regulator [Streptomyces sp. CNQ-509]